MNWVGGIRDKAHRNSDTLMKQKEHFQKQRFSKQQQRLRKNTKKGVSRDILNLDCITKTVRNPFDDVFVEDDDKAAPPPKMSKKSDMPSSSQSLFKNRGLPKHFVSSSRTSQQDSRNASRSSGMYQSRNSKRAKRFPGTRIKDTSAFYQSTPLPSKDLPWSYPQSPKTTTTDSSLSSLKFNLPSPIPSQESFQSSSANPITLLLSDNDNLQSQPMLFEPRNCNQHREATLLNQKDFDFTRYSDMLHGQASCSHYPGNKTYFKEEPELQCTDRYKNYEVINESLLPSNHIAQYHQPASSSIPRKLSAEYDNRVLPDIKSTSSYPMLNPRSSQLSYPQIKKEIDDEDVFLHSNLISNNYCGISSSDGSFSSSPTCFSSLLTSSKSSKIQNSPVSTPFIDPIQRIQSEMQNRTSDRPLFQDKEVQVSSVKMVDASTSPIKCQKQDFSVQVSISETNNGEIA